MLAARKHRESVCKTPNWNGRKLCNDTIDAWGWFVLFSYSLSLLQNWFLFEKLFIWTVHVLRYLTLCCEWKRIARSLSVCHTFISVCIGLRGLFSMFILLLIYALTSYRFRKLLSNIYNIFQLYLPFVVCVLFVCWICSKTLYFERTQPSRENRQRRWAHW